MARRRLRVYKIPILLALLFCCLIVVFCFICDFVDRLGLQNRSMRTGRKFVYLDKTSVITNVLQVRMVRRDVLTLILFILSLICYKAFNRINLASQLFLVLRN